MATEEPISASVIVINDDLKKITGNPKATLSKAQVQMLKDAMDENNRHFMVVGTKGSGKTFLAAEIAKMKLKKSKFIMSECRAHSPANGYTDDAETSSDEGSVPGGEDIRRKLEGTVEIVEDLILELVDQINFG